MKTIIVNKTKFKIIKKENYNLLFKQNRFHNNIIEYTTCHCKYCGKKFGIKKRNKFLGNKIVFLKHIKSFKQNIEKNNYLKEQLKFLLLTYNLDELVKLKSRYENKPCLINKFTLDRIYGVDSIRNAIEVKKYEFECLMKELGDSFKKEVNNKKVRI